jgi:hypothetical protein
MNTYEVPVEAHDYVTVEAESEQKARKAAPEVAREVIDAPDWITDQSAAIDEVE